jgi:hypothetical protein
MRVGRLVLAAVTTVLVWSLAPSVVAAQPGSSGPTVPVAEHQVEEAPQVTQPSETTSLVASDSDWKNGPAVAADKKTTSEYPNADWRVAAVIQSAHTEGVAAALGGARAAGLAVAGSRIRVIVEASTVAQATTSIVATGAEVEASAGSLLQVLASPDQLSGFVSAGGISYVRPPLPHVTEAVTDEGVASTNASGLQLAGQTGAGVKVAVIDLGFTGLAAAQSSGDLPASLTAVDDCSGGFDTTTEHGTAVAEVVHKMAPDASLYLICVGTEVQLAQAETYAKANGITIVNHSVAWFNSSRGDGSGADGTPDATVADANANGILWVNAAGNAAQTHWSGTFADNGYGWNLFAAGDIGNSFYLASGMSMCAHLKWDSWPVTSQDYDLYLARSSDGLIVASSRNTQNGIQPPTEDACFTNPSGVSDYFFVAIYKYIAAAAPRFDLFVSSDAYLALQHQVAAGSVTEPASSPSAFAAGAVCWQGTTIEPFSSRGPTIDGRVKPDLSGPDGVSSFTYGSSAGCNGATGFFGTSAAAPHVAGAAALVESAHPSFTATQVKSYLQTNAKDLGTTGKDNTYGSGLLFLPSPPGKPTGVTATAWDGSAIVSWTAPPANGSTITSYTVTSDPDGQTCIWSNGPLTCTVPSLNNGDSYSFTVTATNSSGTGPESDPSNSAIPAPATAPGAPTKVSAVGLDSSARISWTAAVPNRSTITLYTATSSPDGLTCAWTSGPLSCTVLGLKNRTVYTFTVTATNGVDTGPASSPPVSATPLAGATYYALNPARVLDSRPGTGHVGAVLFHSRTKQTVTIATAASKVPANAVAVTGNVTVVGQKHSGYVTVAPSLTSNVQPPTSTINFPAGDTRANGVTVPLSGGKLDFMYWSASTADTVDILFDVTGYLGK